MQLAGMDTDTYTKEASCILSNLRNRVMRLFCQIPSIDIALINLLKSCMEYRCIYSTLIKLLGSFPVSIIACMADRIRWAVQRLIDWPCARCNRMVRVLALMPTDVGATA